MWLPPGKGKEVMDAVVPLHKPEALLLARIGKACLLNLSHLHNIICSPPHINAECNKHGQTCGKSTKRITVKKHKTGQDITIRTAALSFLVFSGRKVLQ